MQEFYLIALFLFVLFLLLVVLGIVGAALVYFVTTGPDRTGGAIELESSDTP